MKKALHIDSANLEWLKRDDDSLLIKRHAQSPLRFPFCRISRITLTGHWDQGLDVFCHCASLQIPVFFFDGRGNIRCQLMPHQREPLPLADYLEELTYSPAMQTVYTDWLDTQRRVLLREAGACSGMPEYQQTQLHDKVIQFVRQAQKKADFDQLLEWYLGFFQADVAQHLLPFGADPCRPECARLVCQLTSMFTPMLELKCADALIAYNQPPNLASAASGYHRHAEEIGFLLDRMLNQLLWQFEACA